MLKKTSLSFRQRSSTHNKAPERKYRSQSDQKNALDKGISFTFLKPFNVAAKLEFEDNIVDSSDDFVSKSGIRKAITERIAQEPGVWRVDWRQTRGVIELGPSIPLSIPLESPIGLGLSYDCGFQSKVILCYRKAMPLPVYLWHRKHKPIEPKNFFPCTPAEALTLSAGTEIELSGLGTLGTNQGFSLSEDVGVMNFAKFGASASFSVTPSVTREYSLVVLALDGKERVRVTIGKARDTACETACSLRAGILGAAIPLPNSNLGPLTRLVLTGVNRQVENVITNYGSLVANITSSSSDTHSTLCCYDIDLSHERAQRAYEKLMRLNPTLADELAQQAKTGVTKVTLKQHENKASLTSDFKAFNQLIYLTENSEINQAGSLIRRDGKTTIYYGKIYEEKSDNIITGTRSLSWDDITIKNNEDGTHYTYYRFCYARHNKVPSQHDVDNFCRFARRLGATPEVTERHILIDMSTVAKIFSGDDDITARVELYITEAGVQRIQNANAAIGSTAFQKALLPERLRGKDITRANRIFEEYQALEGSFWALFGKTATMEVITASYNDEFKSDFSRDYQLFQDAKEFGKLVASFTNANNKEDVKALFSSMGKQSWRFDYKQILPALAEIAGRENLKVHKLSMSGGSITIKAIDEGEIVHPRDEVNNIS